MTDPRHVSLRWHRIYRVVAAKHPPVNVFEDIVGARQLDMAWHIESLTNDRLRDESGELPLVADEDRLQGPGASIVMAPFTHLGRPSRFSDGSYGVYYAARSLETAVRETAFHRGRFLAATSEPPCEVDMRAYVGKPVKPFLDIRATRYAALHDPDDDAAEICAAAARERSLGIRVPQRASRRRRMHCGVQAAGREYSNRGCRARLCLGRRAREQGVREVGSAVRAVGHYL